MTETKRESNNKNTEQIDYNEMRLGFFDSSLHDLINECRIIDKEFSGSYLPDDVITNEAEELNCYETIINHENVTPEKHIKFVTKFYTSNESNFSKLLAFYKIGKDVPPNVACLNYKNDRPNFSGQDNISIISPDEAESTSIYIKKFLWYSIMKNERYERLLMLLCRTIFHSLSPSQNNIMKSLVSILEKRLNDVITNVNLGLSSNSIGSNIKNIMNEIGFGANINEDLDEDFNELGEGLKSFTDENYVSSLLESKEDINVSNILEKVGLKKILNRFDDTGTLENIFNNPKLNEVLNGMRGNMEEMMSPK